MLTDGEMKYLTSNLCYSPEGFSVYGHGLIHDKIMCHISNKTTSNPTEQ